MSFVGNDATRSRADNAALRSRQHVGWCLLPHLVFVLLAVGLLKGGLWTGLPIVFLLVVVPGLDLLTGWQDDQPFEHTHFSRFELAVLRGNPRLYAALNIAAVVVVAFSVKHFGSLEAGLLLGSTSLISAVGFAGAHELLHGQHRLDQLLERLLTPFLFYPHYKLIHVYAHHVHVGTPADENTAWRGESIYQYLWRTVPGSLVRCWKLDGERRSRVNREATRHPLGNRMLLHAAGQVGLLAALYWLLGPIGLLFYVCHVVGAHVVLESVNYIQHYGLLRSELSQPGKYERTQAQHSWDSYHFFSSYVTFRVGHHANHHLSAGPYYLLAPEADAPKLPVGYFWAIPLVLFPPAWWLVIDCKSSDDDSETTAPPSLA